MAEVKIYMSVDTEKLRNQFPKGGKITTHDIIKMTDDQTDSYYKDDFEDQLVTVVDPDDSILWQLNTSDPSAPLVLTQCDSSTKLASMFEIQPAPSKSTSSNLFTAKLKKDLPPSDKGAYTFKFAFKEDTSIVWTWDPAIQTRPPKP